MSNKQYNDITNLVLEYQQAKKDNLPECKTLKNKIFIELLKEKFLLQYVRNLVEEYNRFHLIKLDEDDKGISIFWEIIEAEHIFDTFDVSKNNNFVKYMQMQIKNYIRNKLKKLNKNANIKDSHGHVIKNEEGYPIQYKNNSMDENRNNDDGDSYNTLHEKIGSNENLEGNILKNDSINMLLSIMNYNIIHFLEHKGKAFNSTRLMYIKMFYTETIIHFFKKSPYPFNDVNSQQIFSAIDINLLDMVMKSLCREVSDITYSRLKKYYEVLSDISEDKKSLEIEVPFINKIFIKYVELATGNTVSDSSISQQKGNYKEVMSKWISKS